MKMPFRFEPPSAEETLQARVVRVPARLTTKTELFAALAQAVPLPDYFGKNWDALEECLSELSEAEQPKMVFIHDDIPLPRDPDNQHIYLHILAAVAMESERLAPFFPEKYREEIEAFWDTI